MKRIVFILTSLVLLVAPLAVLSSADWGGSINSDNTVQSVDDASGDDPLASTQRLNIYFDAPLGSRWSFYGRAAAVLNNEPYSAVDVERLYLQRSRNFVTDEKYRESEVEQAGNLVELRSRMGRINLSDGTGLVMSHPADGVNLIIFGARSEIVLGAGYTGFINKKFSGVSLSIQDLLDADDSDTYFGPQRLLGRATLAYPELFLRQNVRLGFVVQQDLRDPDSVVENGTDPANTEDIGGLLDTQYGIAQLAGPLTPSTPLYYRMTYAFNSGRTMGLLEDDASVSGQSYQYAAIIAHMVDAQLRYFMPQFLNSSVTAGVTYTSGDADYTGFTEGNTEGDATMFTPVTPVGKGLVFGLEPGNATTTEISYSVRPFESSAQAGLKTVQTQLSVYSFFRSAGSGPVSVATVDPATEESYLGTEVDLAVRARPFSDLGVGITGGIFSGNDAALYEGAEAFNYAVRLNASLSY